jgi:hypothetical protein
LRLELKVAPAVNVIFFSGVYDESTDCARNNMQIKNSGKRAVTFFMSGAFGYWVRFSCVKAGTLYSVPALKV